MKDENRLGYLGLPSVQIQRQEAPPEIEMSKGTFTEAVDGGQGVLAHGFGAEKRSASRHTYVGLSKNIHILCIYGILGREITKLTVIYGVYLRSRLTLHI